MNALQQLPIENPKDSRDVNILDLHFDIIVQILRCLSQEDRLNVSQTCTQLRDYSLHRCLWNSLYFDLTHMYEGLSDSEKPNKITFENEVEREVLEACVHNVKNFKFHLNGSFTHLDMDTELFQHLDKATKSWCLKSFSFVQYSGCCHCFSKTSFFCSKCQMTPSLRQIFANCLTSQNDQFESLNINNRTCGQEDGVSVPMKILIESPSNFTFKGIHIDWCFNVFPAIPSAHLSAFSLFLSKCPSLQELSIHSRYLTNELLQNLSKQCHVKLRRLRLAGGQFSETLTSWPNFLASSPTLKVMVVMELKNSNIDEIRNALPEIIPMSHWSIMQRDSDPGSYDLVKNHLQFLHEHAWTLEDVYLNLCKMDLLQDCENIILSLARKCRRLSSFYFDGNISSNCILQLAKLKKWKSFVVKFRGVRLDETFESDYDKDIANLCKAMEYLGKGFEFYEFFNSNGNCNVAVDVRHTHRSSSRNGMQLTALPTRFKVKQ